MLSAADRAKFRSAQEQVLDLLGVPGVWTQAKPPHGTSNVTIGFKTVTWSDVELVNAYGIGAKVLTVKARDIARVEKFDKFGVGTERYTADAAMPVHINGELVFWKVICKGK